MKLADGIHAAVPRDLYDAMARVNFSALKHMARSPAHYRHYLLTKPEDTDPKRLGRAVHLATLEPERFRETVAVWDGGARRGKDFERFCEEHEGKELLTEHQHETALAVQKAVRSDATAMKYLSNGHGEVTMLATRTAGAGKDATKLLLKGRIDFDGANAIADLKSTFDASISAFGRQAFSMSYEAQSAWYSDLYFQITGIRKEYVLVAVESAPPHVVQVYRMTDQVLQLGREKYQGWLDRLAFCTANSVWPTYFEGELDLQPPAWMTSGDGGLGLDWGDDDKSTSNRYGGLPREET